MIEWEHVVPTTECVMSKSIVEGLRFCLYAVLYLALKVRSSHRSYEGQTVRVYVCYIAWNSGVCIYIYYFFLNV